MVRLADEWRLFIIQLVFITFSFEVAEFMIFLIRSIS